MSHILETLFGSHKESDSVENFDFIHFIKTKISNVDKRAQIELLELDYKHAQSVYLLYSEDYKQIMSSSNIKDNDAFNEVKRNRDYHYNLMKECRKQIRDLKNQIV
jgi:hypothetical protein